MKTVRLYFYILLLTTTTTFCHSQWHEYKKIDGVQFSVQDMSCDQMTHKFIKVENTTNTKVKVTYQLEIRFQSNCVGCEDSPEYKSEITLSPGEKAEGGCNSNVPARLDILVANPYLPNLQFVSFSIKNVAIEMLD